MNGRGLVVITEVKVALLTVGVSVFSSGATYVANKLINAVTIDEVRTEIQSQLAPLLVKLESIDDKIDREQKR